MKQPRDYIALALDNTDDIDTLQTLVMKTSEFVGTYKLGLEQFTRFGPRILDMFRTANRKIFLDLKFHDIPNTVAKAVAAACRLNVDFITIHTQGGIDMMRAAVAAAEDAAHRPTILGVTLLTSIDQTMLNNELAVPMKTCDYVKHLAQLAVEANIDGLVCSAADLDIVKPILPAHFEVVTPGIRLAGGEANDQRRVATPSLAIKSGATMLVVGRPITAAQDPQSAAAAILADIGAR